MNSAGEVPKWLKGLPWKGSRSLIAARGFKSLLLRLAVGRRLRMKVDSLHGDKGQKLFSIKLKKVLTKSNGFDNIVSVDAIKK